MSCKITGAKRYSGDLLQGGLEIPCVLLFEGDEMLVKKVKRLLHHSEEKEKEEKSGVVETPSKKIKLEDNGKKDCISEADLTEWLFLNSSMIKLYMNDKCTILEGRQLNDRHMTFAQNLLKCQFPNIQGLTCTLMQTQIRFNNEQNFVQILHVRQNHWIVISNLLCGTTKIDVFDTVYFDIDENTAGLINNMFDQPLEVKMFQGVQKQKGSVDCGPFCIAIATSILHGSPIMFTQSLLRSTLISRFESFHMSPFP